MSGDRYYEGVLAGKPYRMDRLFRGKLLDLRECAALFRGRSIEIHGLRHGRTEYSVECRLVPDAVLPGIANVTSLGTVGMNKDYRLDRETSPLRPHGLQEGVVSGFGVDGGLLDQDTRAALSVDDGQPECHGEHMYATGPAGGSESLLDRDIRLASQKLAGSWAKAFGLA